MSEQTGSGAPVKQPGVTIPQPKKKYFWRRALIVLAVAAALAGWFVIRPLREGARQMNDLLYHQAAVSYQDITVSVSGTAAIRPADSYRATVMVQGEITDAPFEEGDTVQEGDLLFQFDTKSAENSIQRAEIAAEQARINYQSLLDSQSDSKKDLDIKAPEGGVLSRLYVEEGDTVAMGSPIAEIVDRTHMKLTLPFHSADAAGFAAGQAALVRVGSESLEGTVEEIEPVDQPGAGGTLVRQVTILVRNPGALSPSTTGTASVGGVGCAAAGTFRNAAAATVTARTSGKLEKLYYAEGDTVRKDQLLGYFEAKDMDAQVKNSLLSLRSAQLSLDSARDQLDNYTVTSPITGTVIEKNYKAGDTLEAAGGYLAVIYDMSSLTFEMQVDELYINRIKPGQTVRITANALEGQEFTGTVDRVNINGTTMNGVTTYPVRVKIRDAGDLLPGMNVSAEILVEHADHVLSVPVEMVGRGNVVQVLPPDAVDKDGKPDYSRLEQRAVTLGRNDERYIEILSGLQEGETVVYKTQVTSIMEQMMGAMSGQDSHGTGTAVTVP